MQFPHAGQVAILSVNKLNGLPARPALVAAAVLMLCLSSTVWAQADRAKDADKRDGQAQSEERRAAGKKTPGMTKAREAAALAFVQEHHPELQELLIQLAESQPNQYEAALRDLFRTSERLATFHEKDPARYDLELDAWKLNSRVQLLSARLLMTPSDNQLKTKLKQTMLQHVGVRRELLLLERERMTKRLERINMQIETIDTSGERLVDRQIKALVDGAKTNKVNTSVEEKR